MSKLMIVIFLCLSFQSAFSQQRRGRRSIDAEIAQKLQRIERLGQTALHNLSHSEKQQLVPELNDVIQVMRGGLPGGGGPAPVANLFCKWMDGRSDGITKRGYHLLEKVRGIYLSHSFYGNDNIGSKINCHNVLIQQVVDPQEVIRAKRSSCSCDWYPATNHHEPLHRGHHMTYQLDVPGENGPVSLIISSKFYGNNSTPSRESCNRDLIQSNFTCQ